MLRNEAQEQEKIPPATLMDRSRATKTLLFWNVHLTEPNSSSAALEETHRDTYRSKHGEDGSLKCLYGFTLDREAIQSQQKYCMQPVHVILLQPSSFWQGKEKKQ